MNKVNNSLEIFFSYGHSAEGCNELPPIVAWLKNKIIERNHTVFIDVERLPNAQYTNWPNSDWRKAIYDGINKSNSVIGLLSERGLRDNGVCLDELSIAVSNPGRNIVTVLLESQATMKIPPTISRIQWVDMADWQNYYDGSFDNSYFDDKFNEIIKRIESKDNFLYQADINFLIKALNPSATVKTSLFDILRKESNDNGIYVYENRMWLNKICMDFMLSNKKYLVLNGGAGYGKSQFIAHCIHNIPDICAYFFVKYNNANDSCNEFLRTLAFELAAKLPDYRLSLINSIKGYPCFNATALNEVLLYYRDQNDSNLFDLLFHCDKIKTIYGNGNIVICVDALDEAGIVGKNDILENPIVNLFIKKHNMWPTGFKFILTTRDESNIISRLEILGDDIKMISLDNNNSDEDISKYLKRRLVETGKINEKYIKQLVVKCEKTFIYADLLVKSIEDGTIIIDSKNDLNNLPKGYSGLLLKYFDRLFFDKSYSSVKKPLGLIVANNGSIPISVISEIMKKEDKNWNYVSFITQMRSFVVKKDNTLTFYHKSLDDWLTSEQALDFYLCVDDYKEEIFNFAKSYIDNFEKLKNIYDDATGFELLDDAATQGYSYEKVKFVYESYIKFASKREVKRFKYDHIVFIALLLNFAYKNSDLYFSKQVFDMFKTVISDFSKMTASDKFYTILIYSIMGEIELARGNEIPQKYIYDRKTINSDNCECAIHYFIFIENIFPELSDYPRLYCSIKDDMAFLTRSWKNNYPDVLNEALSMLNALEKYIEECDFDGKNDRFAHLYYHMGIINHDMQQYDTAINNLNKAERYIGLCEAEFGGNINLRGMRSLVYNQLGGCYNKIALELKEKHDIVNDRKLYNKMQDAFKTSVDYVNKSLKLKIEEYGFMSFYVANAFDNIARWQKFYEVNQPDFKKLSPIIYEYVNYAIQIKEYIFSKTGKSTARSYMTMAFCLADDKNFDKAIEYGKKACEIDPDMYVPQLQQILNLRL